MTEKPLIMTLLVRDEADIIAENIEFHRDQGVDHFIVTDNLSKDATPQILERYAKMGLVTVWRETDDDYNQTKWVTKMARKAAIDPLNGSWVINCDADEFWVADNGSLKEFFSKLPPEVNSVNASRHDFTYVYHLNEDYVDERKWHERMVHRKRHSLNHLGRPLMPKMAHRAHPQIIVEQGNHMVSGFDALATLNEGLQILHFPVRSQAQFERKITNGGNAYLNNSNLPKNIGKGWRDLHLELEKDGNLETYLRSYGIEHSRVEPGICDGSLLVDERLAKFIAGLNLEN